MVDVKVRYKGDSSSNLSMFIYLTSPTRRIKKRFLSLEVAVLGGDIIVLTLSRHDCIETIKFEYIFCLIFVSRQRIFFLALLDHLCFCYLFSG